MSTVSKLTSKSREHSHPEIETCPLCEQPIAAEQRAEISARIKLRQQEEEAARTAELGRQVDRAVKAATASQAQKHDQVLEQLKAQLQKKDEDAEKIAERIRKQTLAEAQKEHEAALKNERQKHRSAEQQNKVLVARIEQFQQTRDKDIGKAVESETRKIREILAKDKDDALNKKDARHFGELQKLQIKLQAAQRQLEKERADNLGDGQEVDIFNDLKAAFPRDDINRIAKGEPGADIRHDIIYRGKVCGTILYESKNRLRWCKEYAAKLRKDQIAAKADYAILASIKFPAGTRDVTVFDNVLVSNPRHIVTLAGLLRDTTISMHKLRLSAGQRDKKRDEVYKFVTSNRCAQLLTRQQEVAESLVNLDKKELKQHEKIWNDRGTMLRQLEKAQADFRGEIEYIVES